MKGNYYYLHFTDEETKAQRFDVLPKISRLEREGVGIGIVRLQNCDCNHSDRSTESWNNVMGAGGRWWRKGEASCAESEVGEGSGVLSKKGVALKDILSNFGSSQLWPMALLLP